MIHALTLRDKVIELHATPTSYADVLDLCERLGAAAAIVWPDEVDDYEAEHPETDEQDDAAALEEIRATITADAEAVHPDDLPAKFVSGRGFEPTPTPRKGGVANPDVAARRRRILHMREVEGRSISQIALVFGIAPQTVENDLGKIRKELGRPLGNQRGVA